MPGPSSTNKIVQCLSKSFKPEMGREEPFSAYRSAQVAAKPFPETLLPEPEPKNLFS